MENKQQDANGYDTTGKLAERYAISTCLNNAMMGFAEGSTDGLREGVVYRLKRMLQFEVPVDAVKIVIDKLENPDRYCWSIHIDHNGEHYESVIVNLKYDTGYEL